MNRRQSSRLFQHVSSEPNPKVNPALWEHRQRQRRPIFSNPFEPESVSDTDYGLTTIGSPSAIQQQPFDFDKPQPSSKTDESSKEELAGVRNNPDIAWGEQIPAWLNLFYDLAWTATFSNLTQNNKFREKWDSVSYIVFFTTAWWLWVSQMYYNIDFYTDDWFHLLFIFLQLITFGALAATTRDFDVTNYITHTPGSEEFVTYDIMTLTPDEYGKDRLAKISLRVITLVLAISRVLLLIQHLRVLYYAKRTSKSGRFPRQLFIVPASLIISTGLFFGAFAISNSESGREPYGAKIKFVLWGVALLVEVVAHIARSQMDITQGVQPRSHGSILERLNGITTIILGEGINAIAGTFYAVEKVPGFGKSTATGIVCCGIIVFFLAYLYFEGSAPLKSVRRRAAWVMMHLPWLLSVILLLEGSADQLQTKLFDAIEEQGFESLADATFNITMRPLLLQAGLSFDEQYGTLVDMVAANLSAGPDVTEDDINWFNQVALIWSLQVGLSATLNTYTTFIENDTIPDATHSEIQKYMNDYDYVLEDLEIMGNDSDTRVPHVRQILAELVDPNVDTARYIMALCGLTFICLASLNLIQSWPRDRFHWASIFSRYVMGMCMLLLLVLNVGKYQTFYLWVDEDPSQQAGVHRWIDASWVLPTLALAYGIQFLVDTGLVYLAVWYSKKAVVRTEEPEKLT